MHFQFTHPSYLLLLPVGLAGVMWLAWKSDVQLDAWRRWTALALRLVILAALVLAMAGLHWLRPQEGMNVFFVLDRSESVPSTQQETARQYVNGQAADKKKADAAGLVVFGSEAAHRVQRQPGRGREEDPGGGRHGADRPGRGHPAGHGRLSRARPKAAGADDRWQREPRRCPGRGAGRPLPGSDRGCAAAGDPAQQRRFSARSSACRPGSSSGRPSRPRSSFTRTGPDRPPSA